MDEEVNGLRVRPKDVKSLKAVREGRFFVEKNFRTAKDAGGECL
jgi:hypothetical protein